MCRAALLVFCLLAGTARADHYTGPPSDWTAYWAVPAYADLPNKGPSVAKGVIFWSHGVSGKLVQYNGHPPDLIRLFARQGWDVIKVQRNNLHEADWSTSGPKHIADLLARIAEAKAQGYKAIVAAGQSYGGAISLEAGARTTDLSAVLAFAPGHGSDARNISSQRRFDMLSGMLLEAVAGQKSGRVVVMIAEGDDLHPFEIRGNRLRETLSKLSLPFVQFDETMPIKGHGAVSTNQFVAWYGNCLRDFIDPAKSPASGETACRAPSPVPVILRPANFRPETPVAGVDPGLAGLAGTWFGHFGDGAPTALQGQEVCLYVDKIAATQVGFYLARGAGPRRDQSMGLARRTGNVTGQAIVSIAPQVTQVHFTLPDPQDTVGLTIVSTDGKVRYSTRLARNCP